MVGAPLLCRPQEAGQGLSPGVTPGQLGQGAHRYSYQGAACNKQTYTQLFLFGQRHINPIIFTCNHVSNYLYPHGINITIVIHMTWQMYVGRFKLVTIIAVLTCIDQGCHNKDG